MKSNSNLALSTSRKKKMFKKIIRLLVHFVISTEDLLYHQIFGSWIVLYFASVLSYSVWYVNTEVRMNKINECRVSGACMGMTCYDFITYEFCLDVCYN